MYECHPVLTYPSGERLVSCIYVCMLSNSVIYKTRGNLGDDLLKKKVGVIGNISFPPIFHLVIRP